MIFFLGIVSIGLIITGTNDRSYKVAELDSIVLLNSTEYNTYEVAEKYLPQIDFTPKHYSGNLEHIFFEIIDQNEDLVINYYFVWDTENHPDFILNIASNLWHLIYFRFNLNDIEFAQLNIDKSTGIIVRTKVKNQVSIGSASSICLSINSRNHEFSVCSPSGKSSQPKVSLYPFENSEYSSLKMARRSQGDFETKDSIMNYPFIIFLALLATYYFRHLQKDYNNEYPEN